MRQIVLYYFEKQIYISPNKLFKTFKARILKFRTAILDGLEKMIEFINEIFRITPYYHKSEKKKFSITWSYDVMKMF